MRVFLGITEEKLGEVMKNYRNEYNYTQQKIADYLGIDRTTYSKYETVRKPELDVILKLAALYNVSVDEFLCDFFESGADEANGLAAASAPQGKGGEELFKLEDDERQLLLLYRECIHKKDVLEKAREIWNNDAELRKSEM